MNGMQGYIDEDGNMVYVDGDMMGSDEDGDDMDHDGMGHDDSYGNEGSPGYADVSYKC